MKNRYKAICRKCRKWVKPQAGQIEKIEGVWATWHDACYTKPDMEQRAAIPRNNEMVIEEVYVSPQRTLPL